jgi:hypothetical protein
MCLANADDLHLSLSLTHTHANKEARVWRGGVPGSRRGFALLSLSHTHTHTQRS